MSLEQLKKQFIIEAEDTVEKRTLVAEVQKMDPALDPHSREFHAALILLAACQVGTRVNDLAAFLDLERGYTRMLVRRCRQNKIFDQGKVSGAEWFKTGGGIAFWLDVNCACGTLQRTRTPA